MKKIVKKKNKLSLFEISLPVEKEDSLFHDEYNIILKTVEAVNNFNSLYKTTKGKMGPSTHAQQDLYRAMLIFACAGLDVYVKKLIETKLPMLISADKTVREKFEKYVRDGLKGDEASTLNMIASVLVNQNPREALLREYLESIIGGSLQSFEKLSEVSQASGLNTKSIFGKEKTENLKESFMVRNNIIHEMDINILGGDSKSKGHRTRVQRVYSKMKKHTIVILSFTQELFIAYKHKFSELNIDTIKKSQKSI